MFTLCSRTDSAFLFTSFDRSAEMGTLPQQCFNSPCPQKFKLVMCVQTNKTEFLHSARSQIYLFLHFFSRKMLQVPCLLSFVWFSCKLANVILTVAIAALDSFLKSLFPICLFYICFLYDQPRQHIKKQRHHFANKGPSSQGYCFPSHHVWM